VELSCQLPAFAELSSTREKREREKKMIRATATWFPRWWWW
jgi:hypothetical protein